jgi:Tfp pilus assembly protein PilV
MDPRQITRIITARPPQAARGRAAMTMFEVAVAAAMLAVFLVSATRVMATLSAQQRAAERHALALQAANNLLEEFSNRSWQALTPQAADEWSAKALLETKDLPGATLSAAVVDQSAPVVAKRVSVSLAWQTPGGRPAAPIRLTAWVYPSGQVESTEQSENDEP